MKTALLLLASLFLGLIISPAPAAAQTDQGFDFRKTGSAGFQFLKIPIGARESALGEAAAALTSDANAVFWNVGALPLIEGPEVSFTHNEWLVGSAVNSVVVAVPVGAWALGLSLVHFGIEPFEETTVHAPDGTGRMVSAGDLGFAVAAARRFTDRLTIGLQAKYVHESLDDVSYAGALFDLGALYFTGWRQLRIAFALQHFGPDVQGLRQDFRTPLLFRLAVADEAQLAPGAVIRYSAELVHPTDNVEWVNTGVEALLYDVIALRAGYRINVDQGALSLGAGFRPPEVQGARLRVDYAYVPFAADVGATHRFTVGIGL